MSTWAIFDLNCSAELAVRMSIGREFHSSIVSGGRLKPGSDASLACYFRFSAISPTLIRQGSVS